MRRGFSPLSAASAVYPVCESTIIDNDNLSEDEDAIFCEGECQIWLHFISGLGNLYTFQFIMEKSSSVCSSIFIKKTRMLHATGCTQVNFCVLHNSKKHVNDTLCAACNSIFLYASCKLTAILCQRGIKRYNEMAC